jgi:hypothetical protein
MSETSIPTVPAYKFSDYVLNVKPAPSPSMIDAAIERANLELREDGTTVVTFHEDHEELAEALGKHYEDAGWKVLVLGINVYIDPSW